MASEGRREVCPQHVVTVSNHTLGVREDWRMAHRDCPSADRVAAQTRWGYRPIGLLPTPPRLWVRARRKAAKRWEELNAREWLYAGKGKGANVAAWKQAFFAELAATMRHSVEYIQTLLDLVQAFDKVPQWLLIREAVAFG